MEGLSRSAVCKVGSWRRSCKSRVDLSLRMSGSQVGSRGGREEAPDGGGC